MGRQRTIAGRHTLQSLLSEIFPGQQEGGRCLKQRGARSESGHLHFLQRWRRAVRGHESRQGPPALALLVARGEANARRVVQQTPQLSAMRIGSAEGEMLEKHIQLAIKDGCEGSWMREDQGWRWYSWKDRPKPPPTRLTAAQIQSIGSDQQLTQQIERADIIAAVNVNTREEAILWRRPGPLKYAHRQARLFQQAKSCASSKRRSTGSREAAGRLPRIALDAQAMADPPASRVTDPRSILAVDRASNGTRPLRARKTRSAGRPIGRRRRIAVRGHAARRVVDRRRRDRGRQIRSTWGVCSLGWWCQGNS